MKGDMIMNRFKLMTMSVNRFRLLLFAAFVVAVTALSMGASATYAGQDSTAAKQAAGQDLGAAKRAEDAAHARAQKDAAIKRRHEIQDFVRKAAEGQQSGTQAATPDKTGKGGKQ
jgi:hypothetical protein